MATETPIPDSSPPAQAAAAEAPSMPDASPLAKAMATEASSIADSSPMVDSSPRTNSDALLNEIKEAKAVLDSQSSTEEALMNTLGRLHEHGTLPTKILSETMIGKSVNTLAKSSPLAAVKDAAAKLVRSWREIHRKRKATAELDRTQSTASLDSEVSEGLQHTLSQDTMNVLSVPEPTQPNPDVVTAKREKIREKFVEAFGKSDSLEVKAGEDDGVTLKDPVELAAEMETALHKHCPDEKAYINQARAVLFNLKDKKNPMFNFKLLVGAIAADSVHKLTSEDMASDAKNAERKKYLQDAMAAIDQDWARKNGQMRISGMFTCGECKGTQTTYFQMRTRSSDEPMTTFATCLTCGNRWKFC